MKKELLHITDMQYDFVAPDGKLAVRGADKLIKPTNDFLQRVRFDKTIATLDTHFAETYNDSDEGKIFPPHCIYGTLGHRMIIGNPKKYDTVEKNVFDVWENAEMMNEVLADFPPKETLVYLFGVAADYCVRQAINGYLERGYNVAVIADLCKGIEKQIDVVAAEMEHQNLRLISAAETLNIIRRK